MHRRQFSGARNKLDLNDRVQVRILRKRLKVSHEQLAGLVRTAGDSIAAVSKEAGDRRRLTLPGGEARASLFPPEPENDTSDQISATMLAKISSAARDFRIIGLWRATDRPG